MRDVSLCDDDPRERVQPVERRILLWGFFLTALFAAELLFVSVIYDFGFDFVCQDDAPAALCLFLSRAPIRAIAFLSACLIFALARPRTRDLLVRCGNENDQRRFWILVQLAGFAILMIPWIFMANNVAPAVLVLAFSLWFAGGAVAGFGGGFAILTPSAWLKVARDLGPASLAILAASLFAPEITDLARTIWSIEPLTRLTFEMVVATLDLFGVPASARPEEYVLATDSFSIGISSQCSGVEGFALVTLFLLCYFYAFADNLRFPHVWILLPVGLVLSWVLNVVRIAALFTFGVRVSPDIAVNGFHSHAGWLMFSILALSIIGVSQWASRFQRDSTPGSARMPLLQDWMAACILPFATFMGAALLLSTFTSVPDLWYPLKAASMAGALALFLPLYARIDWRPDPFALAGGIAVGILWVAEGWGGEGDGGPLEPALAALPAGLLAAWIVARVAGTIVLVPIAEELFFRGYVLDRLDRGGTAMRVAALCISTALFALLHGRWILAAVAGLVYGLIYLRQRRISSAIMAHAASNAIIAFFAVVNGDWSLI